MEDVEPLNYEGERALFSGVPTATGREAQILSGGEFVTDDHTERSRDRKMV